MTDRNIHVNERKFNATSTLKVNNAEDEEEAKAFARKFWREEYGHKPSQVVAEEKPLSLEDSRFTVMIANHSSGSLKDSETYEVEE